MKILLCQNKGLIGALIRWQTRGGFSHAAVYLDGCIYESNPGGVRKHDVRGQTWAEVEKDRGSITVVDVPVAPTQENDIRNFLEAQLGKGYDYTMVVRFVTRQQESRESTGKWFCSELVFAAFLKAGIDLLGRTEPWEVSPGLLSRTPFGKEISYEKTRLFADDLSVAFN
jgi:uncharacterized protein YycO